MTMIEYFSQNLWLAWMLVSILCLVLELTNGDFFIMCFAIGGVAAGIVSAFTDSLAVQIIVFSIATLLSIFFVRPVALKYFHKGGESRVSNAEAIIGRVGKVTERIEAGGYGRVKIDGDYWKAVANTREAIEEGMAVRVLKMDSIIVTVEIAQLGNTRIKSLKLNIYGNRNLCIDSHRAVGNSVCQDGDCDYPSKRNTHYRTVG